MNADVAVMESAELVDAFAKACTKVALQKTPPTSPITVRRNALGAELLNRLARAGER